VKGSDGILFEIASNGRSLATHLVLDRTDEADVSIAAESTLKVEGARNFMSEEEGE
jgi:hypothetical protein